MNLNQLKSEPVLSMHRDWRTYSKDNLIHMLRNVEWCSDFDTVQDLWNDIECKLIKIIDSIVPLKTFINNVIPQCIPPQIKAKINKRNRL